MITTILTTMLPVIVTLLLGYLAAWHHDFTSKEATILNRMVLMYAVPLSMFAGTVATDRAKLVQSIPLALAILVGIIGMYALVYLLSRFVLHLPVTTSALAALTASGPAVPFLGPAILGSLFGEASAVPIAVGAIVINITIVPLTLFILTAAKPRKAAAGAPATTTPTSASAALIEHLKQTIKKPLVWAPLLAFVMVLLNIRVPEMFRHSLQLLGHSAAGVALFAAGIVLAAYKIKLDWRSLLFVGLKNVVQPALVFGGMHFFGYGKPIAPMAAVTMAIPAMPIIVMFALEYGVAEDYAPSILAISTLASLVTVGGFIWLTM